MVNSECSGSAASSDKRSRADRRRPTKRQRAGEPIHHSAFTIHHSPPQAALPCAHYPDCVGCVLIGNPYGEQLRRKREIVRAALQKYPSLVGLDVPEVVGSPRAFGYRNQAKLVARRASRGLLLGVYRPGSHQVVDIRQCPVHHPLITKVLAGVSSAIEKLAVPIYDERTHVGVLRYVIVRVSNWTKRAQLILVTRERVLPKSRELVRMLLRIPGVVSIVQNINPTPGNVMLGAQFIPLTGETALTERVGFLKLQTHAGAFLQANIAVARKLYEQVVRWAEPAAEENCIDLYCGVGALSLYLATKAKLVWGIEESPLAIADATRNVRLNGFHNVRFHAGDVAASLPDIARLVARVDLITLNPPRKGADADARTAIVACAPKRIAYVSCDPVTLARDLDWFAAHGYQPVDVQPFDLLPQTEHVECVAGLIRIGGACRGAV